MAKKHLYCPKCKKYPSKVIEEYSKIREIREWDGDTYELIDSDISDPERTICKKCETELVENLDNFIDYSNNKKSSSKI